MAEVRVQRLHRRSSRGPRERFNRASKVSEELIGGGVTISYQLAQGAVVSARSDEAQRPASDHK
jgi:hypothetical protein